MKGKTMPTQEQLVLETLKARLQILLDKHQGGRFLKKCEDQHLSEMVKLCHQIRSLESTIVVEGK